MATESLAPKHVVALIHGAAVAFGLAFLAGAFESWGELFTPQAEPMRAWLLAGASVIYFVRTVVTQYVMVKRPFPWEEAIAVGPWIAMLQITLVMLGGNTGGPVGWVAVVGVVLYVVGSYLNTVSEALRLVWKKDPANKGKIYNQGLFKHSMHINYFGDTLLFTGFAMITGSWWAALIPVFMAASFVWYHIPTLDKRLAEHYGEQFDDYASRTKKFIPYFY